MANSHTQESSMERHMVTSQPHKFFLRFPVEMVELKEWLAAQAKSNHRSLTGEIIFRLQESRKTQEGARA